MDLSVTTDYARDTGDPSPHLSRIAEAGFTHVHWCHHWNTDFLYGESEMAQIEEWLSSLGLRLTTCTVPSSRLKSAPTSPVLVE